MTTSRRRFVQASTAAALGGAPAAARQRPNILYILTDDQRFDDLSCAGNRYLRTPNIDRLAAEGIRFQNSFVSTAICCCSRASVLTGQHMRRNGIRDFATPLTAKQFDLTYPAVLRRAGYRTAFLGKFAIGNPTPELRPLSLPEDKFDFWFGFPQSINFRQEVEGKVRHLTPLMTEKATGFLRSQPKGQPFCMALCFKEPHGPWNDSDPDRPDRYKDAVIPLPATCSKEDFEALPEFVRRSLNGNESGHWEEDYPRKLLDRTRTDYHLVAGVDDAVGKIMATLRELDLDRNTVVVFASDNGSMRGAHGLEGKWIMYEESIRVPLIVRDPRAPERLRGGLREQMALNIDHAPTMLSLAGVPVPSGMQGLDLSRVLADPSAHLRDDWYYEHTYQTPKERLPIAATEGVRTARWKYTRYTGFDFEQLFDLEADPLERDNLAGKPGARQQLNRMRERTVELRRAAE